MLLQRSAPSGRNLLALTPLCVGETASLASAARLLSTLDALAPRFTREHQPRTVRAAASDRCTLTQGAGTRHRHSAAAEAMAAGARAGAGAAMQSPLQRRDARVGGSSDGDRLWLACSRRRVTRHHHVITASATARHQLEFAPITHRHPSPQPP